MKKIVSYQKDIQRINKFLKGKPVVILTGGTSSEREVSLKTGKIVKQTLDLIGIKNELFDLRINGVRSLDRVVNVAGLVFIALHGGWGEDGTLQSCLDFCNVAYTGSGKVASAIGKDKLLTKKLLRSQGLSVPDWVEYNENDGLENFVKNCVKILSLPVVVKINGEGSGKGVHMADTESNLIDQIKQWEGRGEIFAEKYIMGREIAVGMVEIKNKISILPILEAKYDGQMFDYQVKYVKGYTKEVPAALKSVVRDRLVKDAITGFNSLNMRGYGRLDVKLRNGIEPFFLEATTLPGLMENSWFPEMIKASEMKVDDLLVAIVVAAIDRYEEETIGVDLRMK